MSTRENISPIARASYDSGYKNCLRKGAAERKGIIMRKDEIIHGSTLNISAVVSLLVHSRSKTSLGNNRFARFCLSVCLSVRPSVHLSFRQSRFCFLVISPNLFEVGILKGYIVRALRGYFCPL